ncbi:MAG TPA: hypothetical protein VLI39_10055 [Sedimentisphaerales bacterium]|nr:hypothetical protein [Sedimentisphaerales bacterium]
MGIDQVNTAMAQMDKVTHQNAAHAEIAGLRLRASSDPAADKLPPLHEQFADQICSAIRE